MKRIYDTELYKNLQWIQADMSAKGKDTSKIDDLMLSLIEAEGKKEKKKKA